MSKLPLGSKVSHATVVDSPMEGGRGRVMENEIETVGQDTRRDVDVDEKGRKGPPLPRGVDIRVWGCKHPVVLDKQLKGGGVVDGVDVRVAVKEDAAENEGMAVGVDARVPDEDSEGESDARVV